MLLAGYYEKWFKNRDKKLKTLNKKKQTGPVETD